MFTGIIEEVGKVIEVIDSDEFRRIRVQAKTVLDDMISGSSIATNGVCITAREVDGDSFTADLSRETLDRTTLKHAGGGSHVNLERSMRADSRFGGHIVQGHVDRVGAIRRFDRRGDDWILEVAYDPAWASRLVWKGSIAVDGISLTVATLGKETFSIAIIPHTLENTNLQEASAGDEVNLEFDVLAKYVEKLVGPYLERIKGR
jgi:riboflavin synthase